MIFQHTWEKVLSGEKTQTRRLRLPGDKAMGGWIEAPSATSSGIMGDTAYIWRNYNTIYQVGKTYAVQPGRGKKAVARIQITGIRSEDVRSLSINDLYAEGFDEYLHFMMTWMQMHDKPAHRYLESEVGDQLYEAIVGENMTLFENYVDSRPAERYQAWALTFKVVG